MIKNLIILVLVGALTLGTGCTKKVESTGLLGDMAEENVEQDENGIEEDGTVIEETNELDEKQLEKVDLYPFLDENTGLYGYMNSKCETIIEPQFEGAGDFSYTDGFAMVSDEDNNMNYIDEEGEYILEGFKYENIGYPIAGLMTFTDETYTFGVVDLEGNDIVKYKYLQAGGEYMLVKDSEEEVLGYVVDYQTGQVISEDRYEDMTPYLEYNRLIARTGQIFYILDENCEVLAELIPNEYGTKIRDMVVYGEELIKVYDAFGGNHWINSKGKRIK